MELLNIARENAAKILGVEVVKLPASVKCIEEQMKKALTSDTEKRVRADPVPVKRPSQVSVTRKRILPHQVGSVGSLQFLSLFYNVKRAFAF